MTCFRMIGALCLLALGISALSAPLSKYILPEQRFKDWYRLTQSMTDTSLRQIWRQAIPNLPKGVSGYLMVIHQVTEVDSAVMAAENARQLSLKDQFSDLVAKGYTVSAAPWAPYSESGGVIFTIRGLAHTSAEANAQVATIYNLSFAQDSRVVWLQVRQACSADELGVIDRAMKKAGGQAVAEELATYLLAQWMAPPQPETPPPAPAPNIIIDTTPTPPPADPPQPPTPPVTPPPVKDPATTPPPTVDPPATPTPPNPTVTPPPTPAKEEGPRWLSEQGWLSMALPTGWKVTPKAPYLFTGLPDVLMTLYPWEPYKSDEHRDRLLKAFAADQRDIAVKHFSQAPFNPDGATGVMVRYTDVTKSTVYTYYFAKSGRLWRLLVSLPGENAALPAVMQAMVESLRVQ